MVWVVGVGGGIATYVKGIGTEGVVRPTGTDSANEKESASTASCILEKNVTTKVTTDNVDKKVGLTAPLSFAIDIVGSCSSDEEQKTKSLLAKRIKTYVLVGCWVRTPPLPLGTTEETREEISRTRTCIGSSPLGIGSLLLLVMCLICRLPCRLLSWWVLLLVV